MRLRGFLLLAVFLLVRAEQDIEPDTEQEVDDDGIKDLSRGFGTDVEWIEWSNAIQVSQEVKKPVFLLVHKSWCGACKRLKESFQTSSKRKEFIDLSRKFVMVNTEDDDEPEDDKYAPDGRYIPRLYFLDKEGEPLPIDNKKNYPRNAYYFPQLMDVVKAMKQALKLYEKGSKADVKEEEEEVETKPKKSDKIKKDKVKEESVKKDKEEIKEEKPKKKETAKKETEKKVTEKKTETEKTTEKTPKKKETVDVKKDKTDEEKKDNVDGEEKCPHAAKAKAEKEKKAKEDGKTKSGKEETKPKKATEKPKKEQAKKSEL